MNQEVVDSIVDSISRQSLSNATSVTQSVQGNSGDSQTNSSTSRQTLGQTCPPLKRPNTTDFETMIENWRKKPKYNPPTLFERLRRRGKGKGKTTPSALEKVIYYVRDIVMLPHDFEETGSNRITIPRQDKRNMLAEIGLVGKIEFNSGMSSEDVRREVCEVFSEPIGLTSEDIKNNRLFKFTYLQQTGAGTRSLCLPSVKDSFNWNGRAVVS